MSGVAAAFEPRIVRTFAACNVLGFGALGFVMYNREALREDDAVARLRPQAEAAVRAARLGATVALVAADYKLHDAKDLFPKAAALLHAPFAWLNGSPTVGNYLDLEAAANAAAVELRSAQDAQERAGLEVELAKTYDERMEGVRSAALARGRVLTCAAALARAEAEAGSLKEALHRRNAKRLLAMVRANGGVYIKLAQHCAQLDYLLPAEYTETFASCFDDAPRSSFRQVKHVIEEELGMPIEEAFDTFEGIPMASASLAQVHVATLNGRKLAVKVQHKGLRETSVGDLDACALMVRIVSAAFPDFKLGWLVDEIAPHLPIELDFVNESLNCVRAAAYFKDWDDVHVPSVVHDKTTARLLTMSFEDGVNATRKDEIEKMGLRAADASALISKAFCAQTFDSGFVHCDPHAANVLIRPHPKKRGKPQMVLLDHGLYKELDPTFRLEYARLWRALAMADTRGIADASEALGVGDLYPLFAAMLTQRPWDDIANPDLDSLRGSAGSGGDDGGDGVMIRGYAQRYACEITHVLDTVPRQLLLLLKMADCLRHLEKSLGASVNTHVITAHACADALLKDDGNVRAFARVKLRLWAYACAEAYRSRFGRAKPRSEATVAVPEGVSKWGTA
ncbi:ABC1 family-domain-containing protein, partial [Pelagophyceae sp. CCMP2097]